MIPFDQSTIRSKRVRYPGMVSGVYVVQFDEDYDSRYDYPALWSVEASDE